MEILDSDELTSVVSLASESVCDTFGAVMLELFHNEPESFEEKDDEAWMKTVISEWTILKGRIEKAVAHEIAASASNLRIKEQSKSQQIDLWGDV